MSTCSETPRQERQQAQTNAGSSTHRYVSACPDLKIPVADTAHLADGAGRALSPERAEVTHAALAQQQIAIFSLSY